MRPALFAAFVAVASAVSCFRVLGAVPGPPAAAAAWQRYAAQSHALLLAVNQSAPTQLPPPPEGVVDLTFAEFYGPIGDRGLEYSGKLQALDGQSVRLSGYMIREPERVRGVFLLAGWPVTVDTKSSCGTDNPPPSAVHVILPPNITRPAAYRPGRLILIGRLELGPRIEADGRNSALRLVLDAVSAAALTGTIESATRQDSPCPP